MADVALGLLVLILVLLDVDSGVVVDVVDFDVLLVLLVVLLVAVGG